MRSPVAFFISGHGFGHASRQVEIVNALGRLDPATPILIRTSADPALLARTITTPYALLPGLTDPGIVQRDSVTHDDEATIEAVRRYYADFDRHLDMEVRRLAPHQVSLVIGDIPPIAFAAADRLGVPSIAIANFTWDWIYEVMPGLDEHAGAVLATIRAAYRKATRALALPFSGGFEIFPRCQPLPLIARHAGLAPQETRTRLGLPVDAPVALLSFGGYGLPGLDPHAPTDLDGWTIVTTDRTSGGSGASERAITLSESVFLSGEVRYEDLVAAADVVVTKPGYGIIAECAANQTALVYTSRGAFREYDLLVREMSAYVRSAFLSQEDLRAGRWRRAVEQALAAPRPVPPASDGAEIVAAAIRDSLRGLRDGSS